MATDTCERVHVERSGVVAMALPFAEAFPLFSAEGERQWVAGWDPRHVYSIELREREGLVFQTTRKDVGVATWVQTRHEPATGLASFVYMIPDHHIGMVDVRVTPDGESQSRASVKYRMTSLSSDADDFVRAFGEAFEDSMAHWAEAIQRHIVEGVPLARESEVGAPPCVQRPPDRRFVKARAVLARTAFGMAARGRLLAAVATLLVVACRGPGSGDSDSPTWDVRFSHVLSSSSEFHLMAERFRDLMFERTGGRFRVVIYPSGQLGGERVAFEQIQVGAVQMAITGTPVLSGWVPEGQMFDLPFLFETRDHGLSVMNGPIGDWWRDLLLERTGVRSLGFLDYGFRHVYNKRRPVEAPEDLAGLKLRVLQNATYLAAYSALGVQATPMNYGEVYSALQQGVIDGGEANAIGFVSSRLHEVAGFYSFTSITYNPITLLVNEPFYRALPGDIREIVDRSAADALAYQSEVARQMEADALEQMRAAGVEISRPDLAPFAPAVRPRIRDELAERLPDGEALIARLVAEAERAAGEGTAGSGAGRE